MTGDRVFGIVIMILICSITSCLGSSGLYEFTYDKNPVQLGWGVGLSVLSILTFIGILYAFVSSGWR
jgi:Na+-transporting NADH:ubiquinone oxidoreductase subunit NqrE